MSIADTDQPDNQPTTITALQQRITELEQLVAGRATIEAVLHATEERFQRLVDNVPGMVYQFVLCPDGTASFPYASEGCRELFGVEPEELRADAMVLIRLIHPDDLPGFQETVAASAATLHPWRWEGRFVLARREEKWVQAASRPERLPGGTVQWDGILMDSTEQKQAEAALRHSHVQEEIIQAQDALLRELSTPLIPITADVMLMPLIGSLDSRRVEQVIATLLDGVAAQRAQVAILDITGVPVVDTQVANAVVRAAQAVKLLGAQVMLTGIRPEVAQTMVGLGVDLAGIITRGSLQAGITEALSTRGRAHTAR